MTLPLVVPALLPGYGTDPVPAPSVEYAALSPLLVVLGVAVLGVLLEALLPRAVRARVQPVVAVLGLLASLVPTLLLATRLDDPGQRRVLALGQVALDGPALFTQGLLAVLGVASVLLLAERQSGPGGALVADAAVLPGERTGTQLASGAVQTEAYPLLVFSVAGMMVFAASGTLLMAFVGLEVLSLPLYLLAGLARRQRLLSQEAALKYFLLGAFSSAVFLYGLALTYVGAGSVRLADIATAVQTAGRNDLLLYLGLGLLAVGLLFKVGAVPFHSWTPDVYQGSPTPVTAAMAALTKVAGFVALLRVLFVAFGPAREDWKPLLAGVAVLTMVVGAVVSLTQQDVKRMLAWSSVTHAGFLLTGVAAANTQGLSGVLFYLVAYAFVTLGAFAVVTLVRGPDGESTHLSTWQGLGRRSPFLAGAFALFLFSLAGIPLTSGFIAKFAVFRAATSGSVTYLAVVGVVTSAVAAFFYARVVVLLFFTDPGPTSASVAVPSVAVAGVVGLSVAATVVLGVVPGALLHLTDLSAVLVR